MLRDIRSLIQLRKRLSKGGKGEGDYPTFGLMAAQTNVHLPNEGFQKFQQHFQQ